MVTKLIKVLMSTFGIFVLLLSIFFLYIWISSKNHLIKYDGTPCQNSTFQLKKPMKKVIGNQSTINEAFYRITNHILQDTEEDWVTVVDTGIRYPKDSKFKVLGYYSAYLTGPLSGLSATGGSAYLVKSLKDKEVFWINNFDFDIVECNVCDSFKGTKYGVPRNFKELNITRTEIF